MTGASPPRTRVAILGGGVGAMSAAFALTESPGWADRYDVTVYQMGWRLGGKGASGRNAAHGQRIEEHGLHIWMGCYENAFAVMQRCYAELGRPAGSPLARCFNTSAMFSPACFHPVKNNAMVQAPMWNSG